MAEHPLHLNIDWQISSVLISRCFLTALVTAFLQGYTIPLDKRLAADGRGLQEVQINDQFAKLTEALYVAESKAREAVDMRQKVGSLTSVSRKNQGAGCWAGLLYPRCACHTLCRGFGNAAHLLFKCWMPAQP
jgi:SKIP/SNW domain